MPTPIPPADAARLQAWADRVGVDPGAEGLAGLDALIDSSRLIVLGEPNHFIHEKVDFRLWWLERLAERYPLVLLEELGWADGRRIAKFLKDGDEGHIGHAATFGYEGWKRNDRDDSPSGVFAPENSTYPTGQMRAEHTRFYRAVRNLGIHDYYGFDVDLGGGIAYENLADAGFGRVARVPGETHDDEATRIMELSERHDLAPVAADLTALADSLKYTSLVRDAADYDATRPAMALREDAMKRRVANLIDDAPADARVVLMAHAFHLVKDDDAISSPGGVGPGGDRVSSLGHFLAKERGTPTTSIWMLYSAGRDCQPLNDLPREADYPAHSLNRMLASSHRRILPTADFPLGAVSVGHMYNALADVVPGKQADALDLFPGVTPLEGPADT